MGKDFSCEGGFWKDENGEGDKGIFCCLKFFDDMRKKTKQAKAFLFLGVWKTGDFSDVLGFRKAENGKKERVRTA